jgi:uncharacterized protein with GYD domain
MGIFITQGNFSAQAMKGMVENPEDRVVAVTSLMDAIGAKIIQYYITMGEYDFLVVWETDNFTDTVALLMVIASTGGTTNLKTVPAMTTLEAKGSMEIAKNIRTGFRAAGASN